MRKNILIGILIGLLIAVPFYVSVWTWETTTLGQKCMFTGIVACIHFVLTCGVCATIYDVKW